MLRGDGGELWIRHRRVASIARWTMKPGARRVSIELELVTPIPKLWLTPPLPAFANIRLTRSQTGYDLWFLGDLAQALPQRVILHRCEECSNGLSQPRIAAEGDGQPV